MYLITVWMSPNHTFVKFSESQQTFHTAYCIDTLLLHIKCMWEKVNNNTNITNINQVTDENCWPWTLHINGLMQDCGIFIDDYSSYCSIALSHWDILDTVMGFCFCIYPPP